VNVANKVNNVVRVYQRQIIAVHPCLAARVHRIDIPVPVVQEHHQLPVRFKAIIIVGQLSHETQLLLLFPLQVAIVN
jgi:hypothetical protein